MSDHHIEEESKNSISTIRYNALISTLPKVERIKMSPNLDWYKYQGFWFPYSFLVGLLSIQEHFKPLPTDIFLCSFPKTGTTWLKALTFAISTRNRFGPNHPLLSTLPHECVPFLEVDLVHDGTNYNRDPQLPLLATHVPYTSLPKSIIELGCKIIYICRDPKDTFVSLWYFLIKLTGRELGEITNHKLCFQKEFEQFCEGKSSYGPFWDHVLEFWKASLENPERILFLKYEDMKKDNNLFYVRRLAEFINQPFSEEEEDKGVPQKIMELCSFGNLSGLEVNKTGKHRADTGLGINNNAYFRKGEIGDWKNHLTKEMAETIDRIAEENLDLDSYEYQVYWFLYHFLLGIMSVQEHFKAQSTDIVLRHYPKTGTTWIKALTFAISTRNHYFSISTTNNKHPLLTNMPHSCVPFLEVDLRVRKTRKSTFLKIPRYEKDSLIYIRRLTEFINQPFSEEKGVPRKIMKLCSFENLSSLEVNKTGKYNPERNLGIENSAYFRKGQIGDWKN
ncbi:hypothetical protein M9H77_28859 [Catharanthus roseus]|uniref:Uncharacterized protein n=1 Tax=Catharanthus roseus TaxID=4058 RepID=A0ACC0AHI6_CATRO|nr:hypothetical protein M9H77_28859 [Catharanthus roseus]